MATDPPPAPNLFLDVLHTLERLHVPYMVVGAFAAIIYGVQRTTRRSMLPASHCSSKR